MPEFIYPLLYLMIFLYGIVIGSFLNVCIYRIPAHESIIPGSHCMNCGHKLSWYDLFPLFSYLLLKGRCRYCKAKVSVQYPLIEALNGILYVIVFMANGFHMQSVLFCLMTSALLVISVIDEGTFEIPPALNLFIFAIGIFVCILDHPNISEHIIGLFCVSLALYALYVVTGGAAIGGGDVKLMGAAGLVLGWKLITLAFFLGCIIGAFCHVIRMKISDAEHMLAMGPYLSAAIWICALWGNDMIAWYFGLLGI